MENLNCPELIAEYERLAQFPTERETRKDSKMEKGKEKKKQKTEVPTSKNFGFEFGNKVKEILGARMIDGQLYLYVKWYGNSSILNNF